MISRGVAVLLMGLMVLYKAAQLSPPQDAVLPADTATTCTRIRLRDGRYLAYRERGVARERSSYKVIVVHGFGSSKEMNFQAPQEHTTLSTATYSGQKTDSKATQLRKPSSSSEDSI